MGIFPWSSLEFAMRVCSFPGWTLGASPFQPATYSSTATLSLASQCRSTKQHGEPVGEAHAQERLAGCEGERGHLGAKRPCLQALSLAHAPELNLRMAGNCDARSVRRERDLRIGANG